MRLLGFLVGLLALGVVWPALADEKFDPKQVRVITPTSATSTCIGDPKTPICAVETDLACIARHDEKLCKIVRSEALGNIESFQSYKYQILESCYYRSKTRKAKPDGTPPLYASVKVRLLEHGGDSYYYDLRQTKTGWFIEDAQIEGEVGPVTVKCTPEPPPPR